MLLFSASVLNSLFKTCMNPVVVALSYERRHVMEFENEVEVYFNVQVLQGLADDPFYISSIQKIISESQGIDEKEEVRSMISFDKQKNQ